MSERPPVSRLLETPGALLNRSDLRELGLQRGAIDVVFRELRSNWSLELALGAPRATRQAERKDRATNGICWVRRPGRLGWRLGRPERRGPTSSSGRGGAALATLVSEGA